MARNTKASRILNDLAMRLEAARMRRHTAQSQLNTAVATHDALQDAYDALEKELTPTPRKKAKGAAQKDKTTDAKAKASNGADEENEDAGPICDTCGNVKGFQDHHQPSPNYHPFESTARSAGKRSSRKGAGTGSTVNSETSSAGALAVGAGGD